ncbi:MAG: helix-turn-helix transcriptional regulator [Ruminococcaceae bacterium]|nr:helix-turn-helix transcriptional regulator [Oscillospiraceae bacterium]
MIYKLKKFEKVVEISKIANIHYFEFTREFHTLKDRHEFRELIYVDSGYIEVESDSYSGIVNERELIVHKENETHSITCPLDDAPNVIIIGFECKNSELDHFSTRPTLLSDELQRILTDIIKEGRSVFLPPYDVPNLKDMKKRRDYPFGADQMIKLKLEEFFIELIRNKDSSKGESDVLTGDVKMHEVYHYIEENFREKIGLDELCFLFGTNKTSLCAGFKDAYGDTIINHINKLKIKEAKRLLREGKYNLTQISLEVGFSSIHYFSRIFKQYENQSPSSYIKSIKSKLML